MNVVEYILTTISVSILLSVDLSRRRYLMKSTVNHIGKAQKTYTSLILYANGITQLSFPIFLYEWLFYGTPSPAPAIACVIISGLMASSWIVYERMMNNGKNKEAGLLSLFLMAVGSGGVLWSFFGLNDALKFNETIFGIILLFIVVYDIVYIYRSYRLIGD